MLYVGGYRHQRALQIYSNPQDTHVNTSDWHLARQHIHKRLRERSQAAGPCHGNDWGAAVQPLRCPGSARSRCSLSHSWGQAEQGPDWDVHSLVALLSHGDCQHQLPHSNSNPGVLRGAECPSRTLQWLPMFCQHLDGPIMTHPIPGPAFLTPEHPSP